MKMQYYAVFNRVSQMLAMNIFSAPNQGSALQQFRNELNSSKIRPEEFALYRICVIDDTTLEVTDTERFFICNGQDCQKAIQDYILNNFNDSDDSFLDARDDFVRRGDL